MKDDIISKLVKEKLISMVKNKEIIKCRAAIYLKIRKGIGLKLYRDKRNRNVAYRGQALFYKYGLAPKLGRKFDLDKPIFGHFQYGLITQHVNTNHLYDNDELDRLLVPILYEKRLQYLDIKGANVGLIHDELVFIDFDEASCARELIW